MSAVQKMEPRQEIVTTRVVTPMEMLANAIDKDMEMATIDKLVTLAERFEANTARRAFNEAIAKAKAEIPVIIKNRTGHNNKKYADFAAIAMAVDPILGKFGLRYRFNTQQDEKTIRVTCILWHEGGHSEENTLAGPVDTTGNKNPMQAIGSSLTYLQRYSLVQALGLAASEDDDGKAAVGGKAISAEEAASIRDIIKVLNDERVERRLLDWLKVESIDAIPAARYDEVVDRLKLVPPKAKS